MSDQTPQSGKPKRRQRLRKSQQPTVSFTKVEASKQEDQAVNQEYLVRGIRDHLASTVGRDPKAEELAKSVAPRQVDPQIADKVDQSKISFSAHDTGYAVDNVEVKGWKRVDDQEQKEIAQIDPYISAMISKRCSQAAIIGRESNSKFDKGTRILEKDPLSMDDFDTKQQFQEAQRNRTEQIRTVMKWILNCGTTNKRILDTAFAGQDKLFKTCTFAEYVVAQVRNLMTFGRAATQVFRNADGLPVMFRPGPVETIMPVKDGETAPTFRSDQSAEQSMEDVAEYNAIEPERRPIAYVQKVNGSYVNFFTEDDMKITYFQKQALFDLRGYPLSPIEQAIYMVYIHQQTLGYMRNAFVKGLGSKGILSIESTDPNVKLSPEDMEELRRSFHNYVNRNDNSVATPVISGPMKVNFQPLVANPKDMEFLQLEEHVVRALCSAFQVSPQEMGYGHLSVGQGGLNQANKQEEIVRGEETGLRMLLDSIYDTVNSILYESFPQAEELFVVDYVGVGEDTRDSVINRHAQEIATTATLGSLWADSEKTDAVPFGGDVPLSEAFHRSVVANMKYGEFREHFFGEEGASKKPEYDFIMDSAKNEAYQSLRAQPIELQREQAVAGFEQQQQQLGMTAQQGEMAAEQAQMQAAAMQQGASQPPMPEEAAEKSLADMFQERQKLQKSVGYYLSEWYGAQPATA